LPIAECVLAAYTSVVKNYPLLISSYLNCFVQEKRRNHVLHFQGTDQLCLLDCQHMILWFVRQVCVIESTSYRFDPHTGKDKHAADIFNSGG